MNELQRQQYLEAMGIETYMPRLLLPGAPVPRPCDVSFIPAELESSDGAAGGAAQRLVADLGPAAPADAPPVAGPAVKASAGAPIAVKEALSRSLSSGPAVAAPQLEAIAKPVVAETTAAHQEPAVAFALTVWRVSNDLVVVDSRRSQLALPTDALLRNILTALGYPLAPLPRPEVLRWPLANSPFMGKTAGDAREWLETFFEARLTAHPAQFILAMGEEAATYLLSGELAYDSLIGQQQTLPVLETPVIVVPALSDMLQQPQLKRTTWRAIQPLRLA